MSDDRPVFAVSVLPPMDIGDGYELRFEQWLADGHIEIGSYDVEMGEEMEYISIPENKFLAFLVVALLAYLTFRVRKIRRMLGIDKDADA